MAIEEYVPRTQQSIDGLGFLFGAGASYEAGFPLVAGLTRQVIHALRREERETLDDILRQSGQSYDDVNSTPNIEEIADLLIEYYTNTNCNFAACLQERIRLLVREAISSVSHPNLDHHTELVERLKRRAFNRATRVYIFTTNYDLLFEIAASKVDVRIINGFSGPIYRHFSEKEFSLVFGNLNNNRFTSDPSLTIILIKLHGSISWFLDGEKIIEADPVRTDVGDQRCMVLPRRTKVLETLRRPYDRLFALSAEVLGRSCRFVISTGFSFGDQHINDTLIYPKIRDGRIDLTNFCVQEPQCLHPLRRQPNLTHICADRKIEGGREECIESELWRFSEFVKLF
jgi:hypothetical protein